MDVPYQDDTPKRVVGFLNPNYAVEITKLALIIELMAFARKSSLNLLVKLKFFANTLNSSISTTLANTTA